MLVLTQREGFEPSCCCQQTDFEQMGMRPVSSRIVPENCGTDMMLSQPEYHNPFPRVVPGKQIPAVDLVSKLQLVH